MNSSTIRFEKLAAHTTLLIASSFALLFLIQQAAADPHILTNGPGDGTVTVGVDGFGSFGSSVGPNSSDAIYDPVGDIDPAGAVFESGVFINGPPSWLSSGEIGDGGNMPNPTITGDSTHATSFFSLNFLDFRLEQRLIDSFANDGSRLGTILDQRYHITNTAEVPNNFRLTRYVDGDLDFDGSIDDGGGILTRAGNEILFETDAESGMAASTTFVGITGTGGVLNPSGRFEIDEFDALRSKISIGGMLNGTIVNDFDFDGFIDEAYDVTLGLSNFFELPAFGSTTYTAQTLFGNAVPPAPGSSEALPLLPGNDEPPFVFEIEAPDPEDTIWVDPVVAVGYEYAVESGPNFAAVVMPSTAVVPQIGQYMVEVPSGDEFAVVAMLDPGQEYDFEEGGVPLFRVTGIPPSLGLDPNDPVAFPTGLRFSSADNVRFSMDPLVVPEPQALCLVAVAMLMVVFTLRSRQ